MAFVFDLNQPLPVPTGDIIALVGGKAAGINTMSTELGLPVPPAIALSTEACRIVLAGGWPAELDAEIRGFLNRLEDRVGRRFGDPANPLLISVRSGAPVSMPGMMDTILNLGLNEATTAGLARLTGDQAFAEDCLARFTSLFTSITGVGSTPADPWVQLRSAIEAVFRSWNSPRAQAFRAVEGISDDLGTGVVIQAMVFGNTGPDSGTGVLFTRDPSTGEQIITGDVLFNAQGEDVVAGTHATVPIDVLDHRLPQAAADLRRYASVLEHHYRDMCDIEFTIERGRMWLLQTRVGKRSPRAALKIAVDMAVDPQFPLRRDEAVHRVTALLTDPPVLTQHDISGATPLTRGLGASPGVATGQVVTDITMAERLAAQNHPVILVRPDTSPQDVPAMGRSAGVLTSRGGPASHAAVVARGWGIPAVVGADEIEVRADGLSIAGQRVEIGDQLTIDGGTGEVFAGTITVTSIAVPEVATLLAWADELGIPVARTAPRSGPRTACGSHKDVVPDDTAPTRSTSPSSIESGTLDDALLSTLWVKSLSTAEQLAEALSVPVDALTDVINRLREAGQAPPDGTSEFLSLTESGAKRAEQDAAATRERIGAAECGAALDSFSALDQRVKAAVAAWQLRDDGGEPVPNDHADAAYDETVLRQLAELHAEVGAWLGRWPQSAPQLNRYRHRLDHAARATSGGDHRYIASPRVDSYHSVWFELHEYLIRLAGRTREDEAAAGRA